MAEHNVTLSADQEAALQEMGIAISGMSLEDYIKNMCDRHIEGQLDETWNGKTLSEKDTLLNP